MKKKIGLAWARLMGVGLVAILMVGYSVSAVDWWDDDVCYRDYQRDTQEINDRYTRAFRAMMAHYDLVREQLEANDDGPGLIRLDS